MIAARYAATHADHPGAPGLRSEQVRHLAMTHRLTPAVDVERYGTTTRPARSDNLAALCRRHHRLKTHGGSYRRAGEGYTWNSPARAA
ncbi:MAG: hypothetical protein Q8Q02_16990 [Nocardioides sp.]|nr:hypothetical protein [Nocardioides sp.]